MLQARDRGRAAENDADIRYGIREESVLMWFGRMAIPANAPHPENAHRFIDHVMRPDVIARIPNHVFDASAAAWPHFDPGLIGDLASARRCAGKSLRGRPLPADGARIRQRMTGPRPECPLTA